MSKEKYLEVLHRLEGSGLSVVDFCRNEGYVVSTFYYWKQKYGLSVSRVTTPVSPSGISLAPVSLSVRDNREASTEEEIQIELPEGVKIYFRGRSSFQPALELITQIFKSHV